MKIILKKFILIITILYALDFCLGLILMKVLEYSPDGRYYKANYSLNKCNEDIIIFGSSRAETNYAPFVFEDSLKLTCWNTGRGGQTLPFWYAMEEGVLLRYTPKIAIVNIERDFLSTSLKEGYERSGILRPFYYRNKEIRPIINEISKFEQFYLLSKIYAFNSSFYYLFRPYLIKGLDGKIEDKGWKTRDGIVTENRNNLEIYNTSLKLNNQAVQLFQNFITNLTNRGCKVFVAISPNYGCIVESTSTIEFVKTMKNITLLNFSNNASFSSNNKYYKDENHLNIIGAIEYSKEICNAIIKHERTTSGIVNCRDSVNLSGITHIKSSCNLIGKCFEIGN